MLQSNSLISENFASIRDSIPNGLDLENITMITFVVVVALAALYGFFKG
jgi:hypothetical protein